MKRFLRTKWAIAAVVLTVALVGVGIAVPVLAQTTTPPANVSTGVYLDSPTLARVATVLGLPTTEITERLQAGETLAQIAGDKAEAVLDAIIAPHADQITLRVKYGYLTQEQADAMLETMREQARLLLQQDLTAPTGYNSNGHCGGYGTGGFGGMMGGVGGMMRGWGGFNNGTATTPAPAVNRAGSWGMMGRW
ncbi:MAG: hypothetical protein A2147_06905 [Chloroflexi bacterium RBG_16_57_8]|nr:MAG: hypothetical protein A2147_06905 [Chloroflexi bacterium RBG_16_57_8]